MCAALIVKVAGVEGVEPSQTEPESVVLTIILHPSTLTPCCVPRKPCVFRISSASEYITDSFSFRQALFPSFFVNFVPRLIFRAQRRLRAPFLAKAQFVRNPAKRPPHAAAHPPLRLSVSIADPLADSR